MTLPLSEAKSRLDELIAQLRPGEELVLTDAANRPLARLVGAAEPAIRPAVDFPARRHYGAAPVCVAAGGLAAAAFALLGLEPWHGFVGGLVGSVLLTAGLFAAANPGTGR